VREKKFGDRMEEKAKGNSSMPKQATRVILSATSFAVLPEK
jgi:hypothetical protein